MSYFLRFNTPTEAAAHGCFNCGGELDDATLEPSGHDDGRGAYEMKCPACGMTTWFDLKPKPTFAQHYKTQVDADTPRAIACWIAAILTAYANVVNRPVTLAEFPERWFDVRMTNPTTGSFIGIREDWTWL